MITFRVKVKTKVRFHTYFWLGKVGNFLQAQMFRDPKMFKRIYKVKFKNRVVTLQNYSTFLNLSFKLMFSQFLLYTLCYIHSTINMGKKKTSWKYFQ